MASRDDMRVPDPLIPPTLIVVGLGLLASLGWGVGDFGGGLTSRKAPVLGVLAGSQLASLFVAVPILALGSEPAMTTADFAISVLGGAFGASGLALLYRGLAVGRMGVVAPIAAVLTATLPVGFGFLTQGVPSVVAIGGIAFAALSVVLVSRSPDTGDGRPSGILYAIGAGTIFGLFSISADFLDDRLLVGPLVVIRVTSVLAIAAWVLLARQPWRVPRRLWPALVGVGLIDMAATGAYLSAIAIGPLAIAAILASLYPVVTTILAALVLRERVTPVHAAGIAAAGLAVVLIAGASSG
jgi:drug/metabolite transporter (DMT)-like permease